jgi:transcription factor SPN1
LEIASTSQALLESRPKRVRRAIPLDDEADEMDGDALLDELEGHPVLDVENEGGEALEAGKNDRGTKGGAKSRGGRGDLSEEDKERMARTLLEDMALAATLDRQARLKGKPALRKLALLPSVRKCVNNSSIRELLLEGIADMNPDGHSHGGGTTILAVFHEWLRPNKGSTMPDLNVRTAVYEMLERFPVEPVHISNSRLAPVLLALKKHPEETAENKRRLQSLLDGWTRTVLQQGSGYRQNIDKTLRAEAEAYAATGVNTEAASQYSIALGPTAIKAGGAAATGRVAVHDEETARMLGGASASASASAPAPEEEVRTILARRPVARGLTFMRDSLPMGTGAAAGDRLWKHSSRANMKKVRASLKKEAVGRSVSDHKVSIEGRDVE